MAPINKDDMDMDIEPSQVNAPIALSARMEQQIKDTQDYKKKKVIKSIFDMYLFQ